MSVFIRKQKQTRTNWTFKGLLCHVLLWSEAARLRDKQTKAADKRVRATRVLPCNLYVKGYS